MELKDLTKEERVALVALIAFGVSFDAFRKGIVQTVRYGCLTNQLGGAWKVV
jgi:hypothetical protein